MGWFTDAGARSETARLRRRVITLEAQVAALMRQTGLRETDVPAAALVSPEVLELARSGKKIAAIKLHREQSGAGLAEAKQDVESSI